MGPQVCACATFEVMKNDPDIMPSFTNNSKGIKVNVEGRIWQAQSYRNSKFFATTCGRTGALSVFVGHNAPDGLHRRPCRMAASSVSLPVDIHHLDNTSLSMVL